MILQPDGTWVSEYFSEHFPDAASQYLINVTHLSLNSIFWIPWKNPTCSSFIYHTSKMSGNLPPCRAVVLVSNITLVILCTIKLKNKMLTLVIKNYSSFIGFYFTILVYIVHNFKINFYSFHSLKKMS